MVRVTSRDKTDAKPQLPGLDDAKATRNLKHGLISLAVLIAMAVGLMLAVPSLHDVAHAILHMAIGWVLVAIGLEVLSCVGYVVCFLLVFDRAPARFGARVALSELAFGAAVALGGAGSVAVGAWLLIERGAKPGKVAERSAVLFLLTSGINVITLALAGLGLWRVFCRASTACCSAWFPALVGVVVFVGFLSLPWLADRLIVRPTSTGGSPTGRARHPTRSGRRRACCSASIGGCSAPSATCGSTSRCCGCASRRWATRRRSPAWCWPTRSATCRT